MSLMHNYIRFYVDPSSIINLLISLRFVTILVMYKNKSNLESQRGFAHVVLIIMVLVVLGVVGFVGWRVMSSNTKTSSSPQTLTNDSDQSKKISSKSLELIWQQTQSGWKSTGTPQACSNQPMLKSPIDVSKATSILYPGQKRGGNYKPHGGFRFDSSKNSDITVSAPIDGFLARGGRYLAEGEVQYTFDVMNNCGVMYRVGHLREIPANLQKIADTWPEPQEGASQTQAISPGVFVKQGEILATSVGIVGTKNAFFDLGVYDYRQENEASKSSTFQQNHSSDKELSWHAVCWLNNWMPKSVETQLKSLPAGDPTSGKSSDYCI